MKRLLSIVEAAEYLGRTPGAVREMIYSGKIPVVRLDRRVQVDVHHLDKLIAEHETRHEVNHPRGGA